MATVPSFKESPRDPTADPADVLAIWVRRHQTMLWRFLRFLGCPSDRAEDLTQEALIRGVDHGLPDQPRDAGPWLRRTARNAWYADCRRSGQAPEPLPEEAFLLAAGTDGGDLRAEALRDCLEHVELRSRHALALRYRDNASRAAMAEALGISQAGIKAMLRRIRTHLRQCIEAKLNEIAE